MEQLERLERIMERGFATLADLARETNARLDETNARLDETNQRLDETNQRLASLEGRFDRFIVVAGEANRSLRGDLDALSQRVNVLEKKVG
jgi:uncharacterized coiled-coil DUF342 family protein